MQHFRDALHLLCVGLGFSTQEKSVFTRWARVFYLSLTFVCKSVYKLKITATIY